MAYIGKEPLTSFVSLKRQDITGDGTASYTLDYKVASVNDILVYVNHVKQDPSSMTVSGTSLTMGGNVSSSDDFYVIFLGQALQTVNLADNTITTAMLQDSSVTSAKLASGAGGKILQVKSATKTDTQSSTTQTYADVSDMSISITPSSTSSKILAFGYCSVAWDSANAKVGIKLVRDTTNILIGDSAGSRQQVTGFLYLGTACNSVFPLTFNYLDSPSTTSATTYKIQFARLDGAGTVYVNRSFVDTDNGTFGRSTSTITVMEVSA